METVRERHTLRTWTQPEMRWGVPASLVRALAKRRWSLHALACARGGRGRLRPRTPSQFPPASAAPFDPPARPAVDERAPGRFQHATFHNADGGTANARGRTTFPDGSESFIIGYCALSGRRYMVLSIRKERRHRTRRLYARLNSLYCRLPGFDVRAASARVTHTAPPQCIPPSNADAALDSSSI